MLFVGFSIQLIIKVKKLSRLGFSGQMCCKVLLDSPFPLSLSLSLSLFLSIFFLTPFLTPAAFLFSFTSLFCSSLPFLPLPPARAGPQASQYLRELDRAYNTFPNLSFPDVFIMQGGAASVSHCFCVFFSSSKILRVYRVMPLCLSCKEVMLLVSHCCCVLFFFFFRKIRFIA
jgi:hypothetical protein